MSLETKKIFDNLIELSNKAIINNEVPIACSFIHKDTGKELATFYNLTNECRNAIKHCEILCIEECVKNNINLADVDVYVTVEPCLMCGYALVLAGIHKVYFIINNNKFGGVNSLYNLKLNCEQVEYREAYVKEQLQNFYKIGNPNLEPEKRHRYKKVLYCEENKPNKKTKTQ